MAEPTHFEGYGCSPPRTMARIKIAPLIPAEYRAAKQVLRACDETMARARELDEYSLRFSTRMTSLREALVEAIAEYESAPRIRRRWRRPAPPDAVPARQAFEQFPEIVEQVYGGRRPPTGNGQ